MLHAYQHPFCSQMFSKLQQIKSEMRDLQSEHSNERQEMDNTIAELDKVADIATILSLFFILYFLVNSGIETQV